MDLSCIHPGCVKRGPFANVASLLGHTKSKGHPSHVKRYISLPHLPFLWTLKLQSSYTSALGMELTLRGRLQRICGDQLPVSKEVATRGMWDLQCNRSTHAWGLITVAHNLYRWLNSHGGLFKICPPLRTSQASVDSRHWRPQNGQSGKWCLFGTTHYSCQHWGQQDLQRLCKLIWPLKNVFYCTIAFEGPIEWILE